MLKNIFSTAVFLILSIFVFGAAQAQTDYTWEGYGLSFTVPDGFTGLYAEGEIDGVPTFFACMLDPNGELNFIVSIVHNNADAAIAIMKSIKAE